MTLTTKVKQISLVSWRRHFAQRTGLSVVTEFKIPKMNNEQFLSELSKAIAVDGRVSVDRYCRVLNIINAYISSNYSKPLTSGSLPQEKADWCTEDKHIPGCRCES